MLFRNPYVRFFVTALLCLVYVPAALTQSEHVEFSSEYERIYQIRVVSQDAGGKSAIGSGFQVTSDGLVMTNYHVVSGFVTSPDQYDIHYETHDGKTGLLELLDFDIVSDLAVLQHPNPSDDHFDLADVIPAKGETVYALGNPGDWGIVMVPGPTNGLVEHSYENRILFSGSLNPGMSGGPSLNHSGDVIGINVATAGSQLSFLVPAAKAEKLLAKGRHLSSVNYEAEIASQITTWQGPRIQELIDEPWEREEFLGRALFGEIRRDFQCWGDTNESDKERVVELVRKSCSTGDSVYISSDHNAGQIRFSFRNVKPVKLNKMAFSRGRSTYLGTHNRSTYENSTNYVCETDFVQGPAEQSSTYHRIITCIRGYKKMPGLYDSTLKMLSNSGAETFESQLSLSALSREQVLALNRRFVEQSL